MLHVSASVAKCKILITNFARGQNSNRTVTWGYRTVKTIFLLELESYRTGVIEYIIPINNQAWSPIISNVKT